MSLTRLLLIAVLAGTLVMACSDKQKEAERLEQEMRDRETAGDTLPGTAEDITGQVEADAHAVPEEAVPVPEAMPPAPLGEGYTVQVASCENQDYARHLVNLYRQRGYEPYVETHNQNGQLYYRVRVGNVATLGEARQLKAELEDRYSAQVWIDQNR